MSPDIPREVKDVLQTLSASGFEAYLVGGCVRDLLRRTVHGELVEPKDWDVTTDAKPEEVQKLFPESVYENEFGTVGVKSDSEDPALKIIEVTTFRKEGKYTDKRHPDAIAFAETVEDDLSRRDFTVNAMAMKLETRNMKHKGDIKSSMFHVSGFMIIDPFGGQDDLKNALIRTVGKPAERFNEDALRLMRAVRFAVELDFRIDADTERAIKQHAGLLEVIAKERIRDELVKILMTPRAAQGIILLEELNLLKHIVSELREGIGVGQNKHHIYTVFEHNLKSLDYAAKKEYSLVVRLAALLHDIGKPKVKQGEGPDSTFYNHEVVGAKMALRALDRLRFSKDNIGAVAHLIRYHMFYYNVGEVSPAGVRRFIARVGSENIDDLMKVRESDRIGSGVPKAVPYKLRHLLFMIEKVKHDPLSPKMLKVNGENVMKIAKIEPGPRVGQILSALLEEVLDDPTKNKRDYLEKRVDALSKMSDKELTSFKARAEKKKEEFESGLEEEMKKKYYVK